MAGIQNSLMGGKGLKNPNPKAPIGSPAMRARPTSLTTPLETINEQANPASNTSDDRRPSRYWTTIPQTIPSGRPLKKIAATFHCIGSNAKATRAASAKKMKSTSMPARTPRVASEQNLMPRNFDSVYPII